MKKFVCSCGQPLYFENSKCLACNSFLAYDFVNDAIHTLEKKNHNTYQTHEGQLIRMCKNYHDYDVCNVCISADQENPWCLACQLNQIIPNLTQPTNVVKWSKLESAKRRLVRSLLALNLPVIPKHQDKLNGLAFAFLEDQQQNPYVDYEFILTGHNKGLITINLAEADDAIRESTRTQMGELYRTALGHLRHECGHYYFGQLVSPGEWLEPFRELFGNEQINYQQALSDFYAGKPNPDWQNEYISVYAQAHPLEDWAECWAHYLHMIDTLETAYSYHAIKQPDAGLGIDRQLENWSHLTIALNELNRSLGLNDAYPFVLSTAVIKKLNFVHRVIDPMRTPIPPVAVA